MNTGESRFVKSVDVCVVAPYLIGVLLTLAFKVLLTLAFNAWGTHLGVEFEFGWHEGLECVYGPAITLASSLLLWLVIWGLLTAYFYVRY